ncbi:MAG: energy transducer TonB [Xanthomonadales bacterium]|jgi:protein TonB|nr:energy transducer TonB [Xanthomonadales bacterium]
MNKLRTPMAAILAVGVTFGLFIFMYKLISSGDSVNQDLDTISGIRFGPVDIPDELQTRERKKPKPPPPPKEPPPPPKMQVQQQEVVQNMPQIDVPNIDNPMVGGEGIYLGSFSQIDRTEEGDVIPIVRINPMYPRDAQIRGLEGWVKLEFTITEVGTVKNPKVLEADPPRVFNREALRAILKWKFKPRVVEGVAVERTATQTLEFTLDQG